MRTNYLRHIAKIIEIQGGGGGGGEGQLSNKLVNLTCCERQRKCSNFEVQTNMMQY